MRMRLNKTGCSERGAALVIALFTLMLISVVGTALILMAGTQAAVKGNYKSSMHAFYDAKAGLEEARGRLWAFHPNNISSCVFPAPGTPMPIDRVCYIVNSSKNEVVDPTNLNATNPYADSEYKQEFNKDVTAATGLQPLIPSTSPLSGGIAGPLYKWVRITPRTEYSGNIDVDGIKGLDQTNPLFYDGTQQLLSNGGSAVAGASQVLTITAFSVTPYGSRRMVQYTVAQMPSASLYSIFAPGVMLNTNQVFPAAMSVLGPSTASSPAYSPAISHRNFQVNGTDRSGANAGSCSLTPQSASTALGLTDNPNPVISAITSFRTQTNYQVSGASSPSVSDISSLLPSGEQNVASWDSLTDSASVVQTITSLASVVVNGPATSLPNYGTASNPVIAVVLPSTSGGTDGNLTLSNVTGYGILLVTGKLTLSGNVGWRGIILVIGQGQVDGNAASGNEIDGAMLVATTRDSSGNILPAFGTSFVDWTHGKGGFFYDSCWMNDAMSAFPYKVLSFREIPQLQ